MITQAIKRAYDVTIEREWDTIYWALDLHGTCLASNYDNDKVSFLNDTVVKVLQTISNYPETKIIIWSSIDAATERKVRNLFNENGIKVFAVNENPDVANTETGNFDKKFYFSIVVDDKAGFDPSEWTAVQHATFTNHARLVESQRKKKEAQTPSRPQVADPSVAGASFVDASLDIVGDIAEAVGDAIGGTAEVIGDIIGAILD